MSAQTLFLLAIIAPCILFATILLYERGLPILKRGPKQLKEDQYWLLCDGSPVRIVNVAQPSPFREEMIEVSYISSEEVCLVTMTRTEFMRDNPQQVKFDHPQVLKALSMANEAVAKKVSFKANILPFRRRSQSSNPYSGSAGNIIDFHRDH